jgi:arylsulfatase A-like enzyme
MNRRHFLKLATLAGCGSLSGCMRQTTRLTEKANKPKIIFIFSDDLSYRDLSCYGQKKFSTPNLDKLATNGMRFTNAYCGSPECAPSRASLMTGMHMGHCRIRANRSVRGQDHLLTEDVTIAEVLQEAGYTTGFIGKWGIGLPGTEGTPDMQGFDYSYGYYDQKRAHTFFPHYLMRNGKPQPLPENYGFNMPRQYRHSGDKSGKHDNTYDDNGKLIPDGVQDPAKAKYSEDLFQKEALAFIRNNKYKPFFLYYATQLPHGPCITPDLGAYKDKPWSQKHKEWAAMVEHMDRGVGSMVALLEELGILDNTIIFFAGDNGYSHWGYFGRPAHDDDPLFKNKGPWPKGKFTCTHEGGMRVPFFAYWKGKIKAKESEHICALYDILATTADLAGAVPPKTDGISLVPTLLSKPDEQRKHKYLYWENGTRSPHAQSVRMDQWWAYHDHPSRQIELYDITKDIDSKKNLAEDHPNIATKIKQIFKEAHVDSKWYINPGQSELLINAKRQKAQSAGQMQKPVGPNTTYRGRDRQIDGEVTPK